MAKVHAVTDNQKKKSKSFASALYHIFLKCCFHFSQPAANTIDAFDEDLAVVVFFCFEFKNDTIYVVVAVTANYYLSAKQKQCKQ